jgi:ribosomal protein S18 acetylase RimI-like enzyme
MVKIKLKNFRHKSKMYRIKALDRRNLNQIFRLCVRCTDFFELVEEKVPSKNDALSILTELPSKSDYKNKFVFGVFNQRKMVALIDLVKGNKKKNECTVGLLLIDPKERGHGLGCKLHEKIIELAKKWGLKRIRLWVAANNIKACAFWKSLGYKKIGESTKKIGNKRQNFYCMVFNNEK